MAGFEEAHGDDPDSQAQPASNAGRGVLVLLGLLGGAGFLAYRLYPVRHPLQRNPNFIDVIFANNLVIFAGRLVLLSAAGVLAVAAVFIVISFVVRARAGHWMSKFGPLETQALEDVQGVVAQWQEWWQEEFTRRTELEERVEQSDQLLAELNEQYQAVMTELEKERESASDDA